MIRYGRLWPMVWLLLLVVQPAAAGEDGPAAEPDSGEESQDSPAPLTREERQIVEDLELLQWLELLEEMELVRTVMEDAS